MNINSIGSTSSIAQLDSLQSTSTSRASSIPPADAAASATFSKPAELFNKLQQLQQQDPDKLKEVASSIADSLRSAASGSSDGFLSKLADSFDQVAKTGDLSALQPKSGGAAAGVSGHHGHHGHGHHGGGSGGVASVLANALDQVNQALSAPSDAAAATVT